MPEETAMTVPDVNEGIARLNALVQAADNGPIKNTDDEVRWKSYRYVVKQVDDQEGTISGYATVYNVIDSDEEVTLPGCFDRSLQHNPHPVVLWQHKTDTPCGFHVAAEFDGSDKSYGLPAKAEIMTDCEVGRYALSFARKAQRVGGKCGISVGFRVIESKWVKGSELPKSSGADPNKTYRAFVQCQLLEWSLVTFPAVTQAYVTAVKSAFDEKNVENSLDSSIAALERANETTQKDKSSMSTDFNTALQDRARQRELSKHRSDIEDALYDTLSAVHGSDLDLDAKKAAIKDTYQKHGAAMADWHSKSYFGGSAKSYDVELHRKSDGQLVVFEKAAPAVLDIKSISAEEFAEVFKTFTPEQSAVIVKGKLSAAAQATMNHALQMHSSAIELHGKAMKICKDAFGDDSTPVISGTEMGAMSDQGAIDGKSQEEKTEGTKNDSSVLNNEPPQQTTDGDSGIHSLLDDLRKSQTRRLESL